MVEIYGWFQFSPPQFFYSRWETMPPHLTHPAKLPSSSEALSFLIHPDCDWTTSPYLPWLTLTVTGPHHLIYPDSPWLWLDHVILSSRYLQALAPHSSLNPLESPHSSDQKGNPGHSTYKDPSSEDPYPFPWKWSLAFALYMSHILYDIIYRE